MKHALDTPIPSRSRRARVAVPALLLLAAVTLSACATPMPGSAPTATATPSPSASATVAPTATPTPTADPEPTPVESATAEAPYNGEILVITSELRDGALEVTAMVPKVSESGGTCTLTLDSGESVSVGGNEGKNVTYCGLMSIPVDGRTDVAFSVAYASSTTRAQSATATVEIAP